MAGKKSDFSEDKPDADSNDPDRKMRGCGCPVLLLLSFACGAMFVVLMGLLLGQTDRGVRLKVKIADFLGLEPREVIVEKEVIKEVEVPKIVEKIVEKEAPMPSGYVGWKKADTAQLWNKIRVNSTVNTEQGKRAATERKDPDSYSIDLSINLTIPKPNENIDELAKLNSHLPKMLPDLEKMVEKSTVSPFYHHLYELKTRFIQQNATRLDRILSRHNLYDCETVLELIHPETKQKTLLIQGEMDVVTDGSDGDRWPELDDYISMSTHYQPFTSYAWRKTTDTPNPLLGQWSADLKRYEEEFAITGLSIERNRFLRAEIDRLKTGVAEMKSRSFLIAEADPFIVIPLSFLGRRDETQFGPLIGDFAAVIYENKIYPAIAGDAGPAYKIGEASLRIAKELNEEASPYSRPVSDLHVTYLVFPNSRAKTNSPPDLEAWHARVSELLGAIGGLGEGYNLHEWEDLIAKKKAAEAPPVEPEPAPEAAPGAQQLPPVNPDAASKGGN
ncbi:MAG: hypothetical protein HKN23_01550 [Verrucomicrobiales bacterium]|nr:hypothetical protein [Verrucomicrobiales bacterium]